MTDKRFASYDIELKYRQWFKKLCKDFNEHKCDATLQMLILGLYETAKVKFTYKFGEYRSNIDYKSVRDNLTGDGNLDSLEWLVDSLLHEIDEITDVRKAVKNSLMEFGVDNAKYVISMCYGYDDGVYDSIMKYCGGVVDLSDISLEW